MGIVWQCWNLLLLWKPAACRLDLDCCEASGHCQLNWGVRGESPDSWVGEIIYSQYQHVARWGHEFWTTVWTLSIGWRLLCNTHPISFAQLITFLYPIGHCMLDQFVLEKVNFPAAAVEVKLPIFSSPNPCKETFDEKGQKDWNHFRDLVHFNKQGRNTLCSRPFSPDKVSSDEMLHSTLYTVSSSLPAWKTLSNNVQKGLSQKQPNSKTT